MPTDSSDLVIITSDIVSSFVAHNTLRPAEIPELIKTVHASLTGLSVEKSLDLPPPELKPAVPVKKSVTADYLICLDDGQKFKSLKRHLSTLGMTPHDYRTKWGLAHDYPMVAPGYAAKRSELARAMGLGVKKPEPSPEPVADPVKKTRAKVAGLKKAA